MRQKVFNAVLLKLMRAGPLFNNIIWSYKQVVEEFLLWSGGTGTLQREHFVGRKLLEDLTVSKLSNSSSRSNSCSWLAFNKPADKLFFCKDDSLPIYILPETALIQHRF